MDLQELKKFADGACNILKLGVNDGRFNDFANLLYIKYKYPNALNEFIKLDDAKILEYYKKFLASNKLCGETKITSVNILREIMIYFNDCGIDKDCLCDAFEYLLSHTMGREKSLGEFYTQRHIIEVMVNMVAPQAGESVHDPFAGIGGMLVGAHKYNPNLILSGGEITSNARLANMNLDMHGYNFKNAVKATEEIE